MNFRKLAIVLVFCLPWVVFSSTTSETGKKVKILLIGDSTTEGGKPGFENTIEMLLAGHKDLPATEVINLGRGGETAHRLLESGRYEEQIANITDADYIFVRYGINDWFYRKPLAENFPGDMKKVINRLRNDHKKAQIILMTIIPFLDEEQSNVVNQLIREVAESEKLALFDIYPAYAKGLEEFGKHTLNVRLFPLAEVPQEYHVWVKPYVKYVDWKNSDQVSVDSPVLDPILGHLTNWYGDPHPNSMGYNLLAREMASYLIPLLQK